MHTLGVKECKKSGSRTIVQAAAGIFSTQLIVILKMIYTRIYQLTAAERRGLGCNCQLHNTYGFLFLILCLILDAKTLMNPWVE